MDKLGLDELIVPPLAGVGSAIGFLRAPFAYEAVRSFYTNTDDFDHDGANAVLAELEDEARRFVREGTDAGPERPGPEAEERETPLTTERQVSMRYKGQGWEIPVTLDDGAFDDVGAEVESTILVRDRWPVRFVTRTLRVVDGREIDVCYIEGAFKGVGQWRFDDLDGKTRLSYRWRTEPRGRLRWIAPLLPVAHSHTKATLAEFAHLERHLASHTR